MISSFEVFRLCSLLEKAEKPSLQAALIVLSSNRVLMNQRSLKQRLLRTRIALKQTLNRILDINKKRKVLNALVDYQEHSAKLEDELRVLNQLAFNQASLVRKYEKDLAVSEV